MLGVTVGSASLQGLGRLVSDVAELCTAEEFGEALPHAIARLRAAGLTAAAWTRTDDGWVGVDGGDAAAPIPDVDDDHWVASDVTTDGGTVAVLMIAARNADEEDLAITLGALLSCAAQRDEADFGRQAIEQRFNDHQRLTRVGSYDWHIATDTNIWTDSLYRIYGCEPGSFVPSYESFIERIHPDDRDRIRAIHQKAYEEGGTYEMHERIVWPDGTVRTLWSVGEVICDDDGTPVRMVGVCEDVTEKLIEQERARKALADVSREEAERAAALELNDNVVQGLTAIAWALENQMVEQATDAARHTLHAARDMMDRLLRVSREHINPGDLVRTTHAPRLMGDEGAGTQ